MASVCLGRLEPAYFGDWQNTAGLEPPFLGGKHSTMHPLPG